MPKVELSKEVLAQVDKAFQQVVHDLSPLEISEDEFIDACLLFAIECEGDIKERIEAQKGKPCKECGEGTHGTCTSCEEPLCDDCGVILGSRGSGAYLLEGTRCCEECEEREVGRDNL